MKINKVKKVEPISGINIGKYKSNSNSSKNSKQFQKSLKKELDQKKKK